MLVRAGKNVGKKSPTIQLFCTIDFTFDKTILILVRSYNDEQISTNFPSDLF